MPTKAAPLGIAPGGGKDTWEQPGAVGPPKSHRRFQNTEPLAAKLRSSEEKLPGNSKEGVFLSLPKHKSKERSTGDGPQPGI